MTIAATGQGLAQDVAAHVEPDHVATGETQTGEDQTISPSVWNART
jgi:hypothetical protein